MIGDCGITMQQVEKNLFPEIGYHLRKEFRGKGYGKMLLDYSVKKAEEMVFGAVLFEGNIDFYKHCGFDFARKFGIRYHPDSRSLLCK